MKILKLFLQNKNKRKPTKKNPQQNKTPEKNHKKQQKSTKQKTIQLIVYSYRLLLQPLSIWLLMLLLNQIPGSMCEEENENSRSNPCQRSFRSSNIREILKYTVKLKELQAHGMHGLIKNTHSL